ncbi:MAG: prolyl oligopeptidase family serine peptidase [Planctomycetes bacterium]|nr:prolyl oligopeptidase family serine peptidase [Planctomycetota bacterium]
MLNRIAAAIVLAFGLNLVLADDLEDAGFKAKQCKGDGKTLPYRLLSPKDFDKDKKYPLLVFLHASSECGTDNTGQFTHGRELMLKAAKDYQSFVFIPQCPEDVNKWTGVDEDADPFTMPEKPNWPIALARQAIESLLKEYPIDRDRICIIGISMGGFGCWEMLCRYPDFFAAGVPICGGGDLSKAERLKNTAVWAFHGAQDDTVSPEKSRKMIAAIKKAGGDPKLTEYKDEGHECWLKTFEDPKLLEWIFAQKRKPADAKPDGK